MCAWGGVWTQIYENVYPNERAKFPNYEDGVGLCIPGPYLSSKYTITTHLVYGMK